MIDPEEMELRVLRENEGYGRANVYFTDSGASIHAFSTNRNFLWSETVEGLLELVREACNKPVVNKTPRQGGLTSA